MHSKSGAKYGHWFTIHYIQIYAKHFGSAYHMANEGSCYPAKTFGSTSANTSTITGEVLERGYFWYVSPNSGGDGSLSQDPRAGATFVAPGPSTAPAFSSTGAGRAGPWSRGLCRPPCRPPRSSETLTGQRHRYLMDMCRR
ncbi:unnamed protein product [Prorocentrum cordatum]|uniref:Uncharacterized protein n=1 Tax=Prorocentrum cordatum TaxID=2364126 RepID=A0ABN9SHD2_9DINO|nr:unnamed protein product [Polarella glacialis]